MTSSSTSAITGVWAWGNSVDPAADERGRGQADLAPAAIARVASIRGLQRVFLNAPWATNVGPMAVWFSDAVSALSGAGIDVSVLGGDAGWFERPDLAAIWLTAARATAEVDSVQLDVEPWAGRPDPMDPVLLAEGYLRLIDTVRGAAGTLPIGADLPWWLARMSYGDGTVFDALVPELDSVAIIAFSDTADGPSGILELAGPAVRAAAASGTPFTIGVETDTPEVAGGAQYTFFDDGSAVLEAETVKVHAALTATPGYRGVTVEHLLAWNALRP